MKATLRRYPRMKESGMDSIGVIPDHWHTKKLRHLIHPVVKRNVPDLPLLSVTRDLGVILRDTASKDENRNYVPDDLSNYKAVKVGQFAINKMKAWQGSYGVSNFLGLVSPAYFVFDVCGISGDFFHKSIRSSVYVPSFRMASDGVRIGQWDLSQARMREIAVAVPALETEQTSIAHFIDYIDRRIARYIHAEETLIELLREYKQALICRAVTGQFDVRTGRPYPEYKESEIAWIGKIPRNWRVSRIKAEFDCLNRQRVPLSSSRRGEMKSRTFDYYGASGVIDKVESYLFNDELLLLAEDGANLVLRNLPLAIIARGKFWVNNHAHILKPKAGHIEYFAAYLETLSFLPWISGAAQPKLTQDRLMGIAIAVPPKNEQFQIAEFTRSIGGSIQPIVDSAVRKIALLKEYLVRLTADVVTGKLDVREAAANLPDLGRLMEAKAVVDPPSGDKDMGPHEDQELR